MSIIIANNMTDSSPNGSADKETNAIQKGDTNGNVLPKGFGHERRQLIELKGHGRCHEKGGNGDEECDENGAEGGGDLTISTNSKGESGKDGIFVSFVEETATFGHSLHGIKFATRDEAVNKANGDG